MKRDTGSTYAVITTVVVAAWLGREERQLQVVAREKSSLNPNMCHLYWNGEMKMNEVKVNDDALPLGDILLQ